MQKRRKHCSICSASSESKLNRGVHEEERELRSKRVEGTVSPKANHWPVVKIMKKTKRRKEKKETIKKSKKRKLPVSKV